MRSATKFAALMAATALAFAGCSSGDSGSDSDAGANSDAAAREYKIGITQIVSHPALDSTAEGFKQGLAEKGFTNVTYDDQNAEGDIATASTIAQKFVNDGLNLVLAIATPTAQAMVKADTQTPIVFSAVTDPVGAGLVTNAEAPDANVTGVSDMLPMEPQFELIKQIVPEIKALGVLYNAGESNSVYLIEKQKEAAKAAGIEVVEATASNSSEVKAAADSLVGRVQAISVLTDNTVVSAMESVIKVAQANKIPLIAGDTDSVKRGAVAAYSFDYKDLGVQAGHMAADILAGKAISGIPRAVRREPAALDQRGGRQSHRDHSARGRGLQGSEQVLIPDRTATIG
ncbi:MAG: ABC transporter substrate-binding protein [Candidatus Nanopelagicales bacterium]